MSDEHTTPEEMIDPNQTTLGDFIETGQSLPEIINEIAQVERIAEGTGKVMVEEPILTNAQIRELTLMFSQVCTVLDRSTGALGGFLQVDPTKMLTDLMDESGVRERTRIAYQNVRFIDSIPKPTLIKDGYAYGYRECLVDVLKKVL